MLSEFRRLFAEFVESGYEGIMLRNAAGVYRANYRSNDLQKYKEFCVDYGYKFDEATLYDMRSFAFRQFQKQQAGKDAKNSWDADVRV